MKYEPNMRLTSNFQLYEFVVSSSHPELLVGVELSTNDILKLYWLCVFCLQPLRDKFGRCEITSGYRPAPLNRVVGGATTSQHLRCEAVDFVLPDADGPIVYEYMIKEMKWPGEVIYYANEDRFHVGLPRPDMKADRFIKGAIKTVKA